MKTLKLTRQQKWAILRWNRGMLSRVARKLALSPSHVRLVYYGDRVSAPVTRALDAELAKIVVIGEAQ